MAKIDGLLKARGLTSHERKIYKALLDKGSSHAGALSATTGIHRRNVYDCLGRLLKKGLVGYIKENNKKLYSVTHPDSIVEQVENERKEWEALLPELLAKYRADNERRETLFFRGKAGLRQVLEHQLAVGEEVLVHATSINVTDILKYFFPKYQLIRKERNIPTRMLFDADFKTPKNAAAVKELPLCKARYVSDLNKSPMAQYIYGDNVALVVWSDNPIAILIKQKEIADGFRASFELVWSMGKA